MYREIIMPDENDISCRIKIIRKIWGFKQKDFAEKLKVSGATLSDVEKGKYKPSHDLIFNISKQFNVNLNYLLFGEGEMFVKGDVEIVTRLDNMFSESDEIKKFNWYFEKSKVLRFRILSFFNKLLVEDRDVIEGEIKGNTPMTPLDEDNT
jgi:DNA-binding XRE family transcriptional regulator